MGADNYEAASAVRDETLVVKLEDFAGALARGEQRGDEAWVFSSGMITNERGCEIGLRIGCGEEEEMANRETPVDRKEEFALEPAELVRCDAADASVVCIGAECVAEGFTGEGDGGDEETMAGEGGDGEDGHARADLVYVVHYDK